MTAVRRWCLVALGVLALVATPHVVGAWPVEDSETSATELLERVQDSDDVAYSGYVESAGGVALPVTSEFTDVADLLGEANRLRVWWRSADDWRVDRLEPAGEVDLFHLGGATTTWDYEALQAGTSLDGLAFLPRTEDLLPPELARLVLADALPEELSRLPAVRVAGVAAPGLRLTPSAPQASIEHVDVWVEPASGLPLRVEVWGTDAGSPALATGFEDVSLEEPAPATTAFTAPPGAEVSIGGPEMNSLLVHVPALFRAPALAGLPATERGVFASAGRYGRGVTQLLVLALDDEVAAPLREQLQSTAGSRSGALGTRLAAGPLRVLLSPCRGEKPSWLLVGTVTDRVLRAAARRVLSESAVVEPTWQVVS